MLHRCEDKFLICMNVYCVWFYLCSYKPFSCDGLGNHFRMGARQKVGFSTTGKTKLVFEGVSIVRLQDVVLYKSTEDL